MKQPALFIAHGSPMVAIEDSPYGRFLDHLGAIWPKPRAILVFSAHWLSLVPRLSKVEQNETLYDFSGFPEPLYRIRYPAPGSPELADAVRALWEAAGVSARFETDRPLDHGAWTILTRFFPAADIPVVAASVNPLEPPEALYRLGQALAPLRNDNVLVIASGVTVHNFATIRWDAEAEADPWALEFEAWLEDRLRRWALEDLFQYAHRAPHAELAVPPRGNDHFVPLFYAMGAADTDRTADLLYRDVQFGNLVNSVYQFGRTA
jgi:4,5-DOPA dioxygenase extradiol